MLRQQLHAMIFLVACALVATACVRNPEDGLAVRNLGEGGASVAADERASDGVGETGPMAEVGDPGLGVGTGDGPVTEAAEPPSTSGGQPPDSDARQSSDPDGQQPGDRGGGGGQQVAPDRQQQGVDFEERTIKIVFAFPHEECGDDPQQHSKANDKGLKAIEEYVGWFNEEVLAPVNWTLVYETVDDGGRQCGDKAQAAGVAIVEEIKPFAVLGGSIVNGRGPVLADVVTRAGIPIIGNTWHTFDEMAKRRGLAWDPKGIVLEEFWADLAVFIDKRVKGTTVPDRSAPGQPEVDRVWGMVAVDTHEGRALAKGQIERLERNGIDLGQRVYFVHPEMAVAAQNASNTVLKMRQDGVNTVVWGFFEGAPSTYTISDAMGNQGYRPDILLAGFGNAIWDQLHNRAVWENAYGVGVSAVVGNRVATTSDGPVEEYRALPENSDAWLKVWQERLGNNDDPRQGSNPQAWNTWAQLSALVTGVLVAGDDLTWETWAEALHTARPNEAKRCTAARFTGRDYHWDFAVDWHSDGSRSRVGFTTLYWVNEQTPLGTNGYYESFDNYRKFQAESLPASATHDTGEKGVDIQRQERIGLQAWTPCSQFPNYPLNWD